MSDQAKVPRRESLILADHEPGRRNRRLIDVFVLFLMAIVMALAAQIARAAAPKEDDVEQAFVAVLGWAAGIWRTAGVLTVAFTIVVLVALVVGRRWDVARDVVLALLIVVLVGPLLSRLGGSDWTAIDTEPWSRWGFPDYRLALVVATATVVGPELTAGARRV